MATENGYLDGPEQTKLFYQCWLPETDTRAVLIVVHGLAEHSGRYMNLVNSLMSKGFGVPKCTNMLLALSQIVWFILSTMPFC